MESIQTPQNNLQTLNINNEQQNEQQNEQHNKQNLFIIKRNTSELKLDKGYLNLILGPMFSGKSTRLIEYIRKYKTLGLDMLVIKPSIDIRYTDINELCTHNSDKEKCISLGIYNLHDIFKLESYDKTNLIFIEEAQLDRVGCFAYSTVKGAKANELSNPLPDEVREERRARFMQTAEQISTQKLNKVIGKRIRVLVDSVNAQGGIARSFADAPEIDGLVYVQPPERPSKRYRSGEFIKVTVANTQGHDLIALP
jgi:hypothetical protein